MRLTKDMHGMVVQLPSATRNMYVDGERRCLILLRPFKLLNMMIRVRQETDTSMNGSFLPNIEKEAGEETDRSGVIALERISRAAETISSANR